MNFSDASLFELLIFATNIILAVGVMPHAIYDKSTGEYKGFLNPPAIFWLAIAVIAGWVMILNSDSPRISPWLYSLISMVIVILGSRFVIEEWHRYLHGKWLHKQGIWLMKKSGKT